MCDRLGHKSACQSAHPEPRMTRHGHAHAEDRFTSTPVWEQILCNRLDRQFLRGASPENPKVSIRQRSAPTETLPELSTFPTAFPKTGAASTFCTGPVTSNCTICLVMQYRGMHLPTHARCKSNACSFLAGVRVRGLTTMLSWATNTTIVLHAWCNTSHVHMQAHKNATTSILAAS